MSRVPIELSRRERRVASVVLVIATFGEFGAGVIGNIIGRWWPSIAGLIFIVLTIPLATVYFARTRDRSVRSVFALGLPTFPVRPRNAGVAMHESPRTGWFPDPARRHQLRFFDGHHWTDAVRDDGVDSGDVLGPPPANRDAWLSPEIMVMTTNSRKPPDLEPPACGRGSDRGRSRRSSPSSSLLAPRRPCSLCCTSSKPTLRWPQRAGLGFS